jgi:HK97 gp10 family phage protein
MSAQFKVQGLKELQMALNQLPANIQKKPLRKAVGGAAKIIRDEARRIAPVDTGNLRKNIVHQRSKRGSGRGREAWTIAVRRAKTKDDPRGDAWYWIFLEREGGTSKMAPRPFLRPAFEVKKAEAIDKIKAILAFEIDKEVARVKK